MIEWKTAKLGDLVNRKIGYGIVQPGASPAFGVPVIKVNDIIAGLTSVDKLDKTKPEIAAQYKRTILHGGELVISLVGSVGKTAIVPKSFAGCNLVRATGLIDIENETIAKWVKYYIDSPAGQQYIQTNLNTTVQATLNIKDLVAMEIPMPPSCVMEGIVRTLSSLDSKIENNSRINANLEAQAQALYKSWFVDFEPWGGSMPEDWQEGKLTDIAEYLNGLAMQKFAPMDNEESLPVLKIKELGLGHCDSSSDKCKKSIPSRYIIKNGDVIFSWSGTLMIDIWCGGECGLNQHLFKVTSSNYPKWFYLYWTQHHLSRFQHIAADKAVTMGHIKRGDLDASKVWIPSAKDMVKLSNIASPIIESIIANKVENTRLAALRDMLLPKLMKGEIEL